MSNEDLKPTVSTVPPTFRVLLNKNKVQMEAEIILKILLCLSVSGHLHLLDLGSCEMDLSSGQCLSLSALGNVILALTTGAKHVPYR